MAYILRKYCFFMLKVKKQISILYAPSVLGNLIMIFSSNLFMVCFSIAFYALSYNFASGSGDALAYDSMKMADCENEFERYESNQLIIYRVCSGISTLCAGFATLSWTSNRIQYRYSDLQRADSDPVIFTRSICQTGKAEKEQKSIWNKKGISRMH